MPVGGGSRGSVYQSMVGGGERVSYWLTVCATKWCLVNWGFTYLWLEIYWATGLESECLTSAIWVRQDDYIAITLHRNFREAYTQVQKHILHSHFLPAPDEPSSGPLKFPLALHLPDREKKTGRKRHSIQINVWWNTGQRNPIVAFPFQSLVNRKDGVIYATLTTVYNSTEHNVYIVWTVMMRVI